MSLAVDTCWQLMKAIEKLNGIIIYTLKVINVSYFSSLGWCSFAFTAIYICWQLLTAVMKKKLNEIFINTNKVIYMPNFSSLGWFSFRSAVNCRWHIFTAFDRCWQFLWKWWNGILIYTLKYIYVPNFNSLPWFSFWSAVNSCLQLLTAVDSWWQLL